ncbi:MAG: hypothetical protein F4039_08550 [Gammaproteobacteria bacterium]|nr:hypothetical protein [Gammaproteobacteria bacterium]
MKYNPHTEQTDIIFQFASGIECWNLAKRSNLDRFSVVATASRAKDDLDVDISETITTPQTGPKVYVVKLVFNVAVSRVSMKEGMTFEGVEVEFDKSKIYRARDPEAVPTLPSLSDINDPTELDSSSDWVEDSANIIHKPAKAFVIYLRVKKSSTNFEAKLVKNSVRRYNIDKILPDLRDIYPRSGSYITDFQGANSVFIAEVDAGSLSTLVPTNSPQKPVLANFYQLGETGLITEGGKLVPFSSFDYLLPDTTRSMLYKGNRVLFAYVNYTSETFGVARVNQSGSVTVINSFTMNGMNYAGINFIIEDNTVFTLITDKTGENSRVLVYQHSI